MTNRHIVELSVAGPVNATAEQPRGSPASGAVHRANCVKPSGLVAGLRMGNTLARRSTRLPSLALLAVIRLYQRIVSPVLPIVTLGGCSCRFSPTCSHYAADAIRIHGSLAGTWLAVRRVIKCTPLHPGGFDPVPVKQALPQETDRDGETEPPTGRDSRELRPAHLR